MKKLRGSDCRSAMPGRKRYTTRVRAGRFRKEVDELIYRWSALPRTTASRVAHAGLKKSRRARLGRGARVRLSRRDHGRERQYGLPVRYDGQRIPWDRDGVYGTRRARAEWINRTLAWTRLRVRRRSCTRYPEATVSVQAARITTSGASERRRRRQRRTPPPTNRRESTARQRIIVPRLGPVTIRERMRALRSSMSRLRSIRGGSLNPPTMAPTATAPKASARASGGGLRVLPQRGSVEMVCERSHGRACGVVLCPPLEDVAAARRIRGEARRVYTRTGTPASSRAMARGGAPKGSMSMSSPACGMRSHRLVALDGLLTWSGKAGDLLRSSTHRPAVAMGTDALRESRTWPKRRERGVPMQN